MTETSIPESIKWRGSVYNLEKVEDGKVFWFNPVSRHRASCSIESWTQSYPDPYEGKYS